MIKLTLLDYNAPAPLPATLNIWPHQLKANPSLVQAMLVYRAGGAIQLDARKLVIAQVSASAARAFLSVNHLSGYASSTFRYGLLHGDELVCLMTFGHSRYARNFDFEVIRLATKQGVQVRGGASRLLAAFRADHAGSILSYADRLLGDGAVYERLGFEPLGITQRGYFWEKNGRILTRYQTQKQHLIRLLGEVDLAQSGVRLMTDAGWRRVFDLGHTRWGLFADNGDALKAELKHHFVYRVTRPMIDASFYIGVHSTDDLVDGYLGSGDRIVASKAKYGRAAHKLEILQACATRREALELEAQLVTIETLADPACLNLVQGGGNLLIPRGTTSGKQWFWHPIACKELFLDESWIDAFLKRGWVKGRNPAQRQFITGRWFKRADGSVGRTSGELPADAIAGRDAATAGYRWVTRAGRQTLVAEVLPTDELAFKQRKTNKGLRRVTLGGVTKLVTPAEETALLAEGWAKPKPPTAGRIGVRGPAGEKRLVSEPEARALIARGWTIAAKVLRHAPLQVQMLAKELEPKIKTSLTSAEVE